MYARGVGDAAGSTMYGSRPMIRIRQFGMTVLETEMGLHSVVR